MCHDTQRIPYLLLCIAAHLAGQQTSPAIAQAGYSEATPIGVAPGQLLTVTVQGMGANLKEPIRAVGLGPLPTVLANISAYYTQLRDLPQPILSVSAPILEVRPFTTIPSPFLFSQGSKLVAITLQIPYEVEICPTCLDTYPTRAGNFGVMEGDTVAPTSARSFSDQIHILTSCDTIAGAGFSQIEGFSCSPKVTHADGSMVNASNPARGGEQLVMYAVGLGQTVPPSATGQIVTNPSPTRTVFTLDFNSRLNALATRPSTEGPRPVYAGTTAGYLGLYQVNLTVPPVPLGTPLCVDKVATLPLGNLVQSNLTVSVGGRFSFDAAQICVTP